MLMKFLIHSVVNDIVNYHWELHWVKVSDQCSILLSWLWSYSRLSPIASAQYEFKFYTQLQQLNQSDPPSRTMTQ
jgi:hypothetical protein